jgi:hypothetical protein
VKNENEKTSEGLDQILEIINAKSNTEKIEKIIEKETNSKENQD